PSTDDPSFWKGTIPWITAADIDGDGRAHPRQHVTQAAIEHSAATVAPEGALLLVTRTSVGKVAIVDRPMSFSQDITALLPDSSRIDLNYLAHLLAFRAPALAARSRGATVKGVARDAVLALEVPLPSLPQQRRVAAALG